jgi:threonine synthase
MYEGVFVEPASAASIGGAIRDIKAGKIAEGSVIVCTVTGNGLKDPDTAIKQCSDAVMLSSMQPWLKFERFNSFKYVIECLVLK